MSIIAQYIPLSDINNKTRILCGPYRLRKLEKGNFDYEVSLYPWLDYIIQINLKEIMD